MLRLESFSVVTGVGISFRCSECGKVESLMRAYEGEPPSGEEVLASAREAAHHVCMISEYDDGRRYSEHYIIPPMVEPKSLRGLAGLI